MCGIVGIIGNEDTSDRLIEGLRRLEYRGYDSAGIATLHDGKLSRRRAAGKIKNLQTCVDGNPLSGNIGIGHTRWATHGVPNEVNAHPHMTDRLAIVHNGILENYAELKDELSAKDYVFDSQTDTEVIAQLLTSYIDDGDSPFDALTKAMGIMEGAFALAIIFAGEDDNDYMLAARKGTPLAIGYGEGEMFIASDAYALAPLTNRLCYLDDGDIAIIKRDGAEIFDASGAAANREVRISEISGAMTGKGEFKHFMLKEIYEQPQVIGDTLSAYINAGTGHFSLPDMPFDLTKIKHITISACGTAFYAGMVARYWFEQIAKIPVDIDIASEFRYREVPMEEGNLAIFVTQSGETLDTLEALNYAKSKGQHILSVINAQESTIARASDVVLYTKAGPEISVASTKATTTQMTVLACLAVAMAKARGEISDKEEMHYAHALREVPSRAADVLRHDEALQNISHDLAEARDALYVGRGTSYPIALEGALKLKEISYIHAEGYAAGEFKHGPLALVDEHMPIIVLAPRDKWFDKTISNMQEIKARGGRLLLISDGEGVDAYKKDTEWTLELPKVDPLVASILYTIPMQLLSYHVAVTKGTDVDQPRNLAKSVTVE